MGTGNTNTARSQERKEKNKSTSDRNKIMDCKLAFKTKLSRKLKKYTNILKEAHNVEISHKETEFLAICNAGLTTGLSREKILEAVHQEQVAALKDIHFIENTSVTFLTCVDSSSAMSVLNTLNEEAHIDFFVVFVKNIPEVQQHEMLLPNGLILLENFVSPEEEKALVKSIDWTNSTLPEQGQTLKHRQVRHFGYQFEYGTNNVNPDKPLDAKIPNVCSPLIDKMIQQGVISWIPEQLTVNQYEPGQGIPPHIDTHSAFEDPILSLSLESDAVMEFRKGGALVPVHLPRRSLLVMSGESRYTWTHGITPRKSDVVRSQDGKLSLVQRTRRTSFTFRRLLRRACTCDFPQYCDSQIESVQSKETINLNCDATASKLENLHVHKVYEEIAGHFSQTRHTPWPNVLSFVNSQAPGSLILDVGCGNGKYLGLNKRAFQVGCDMSQHLLKICRERKFETFVSNCLSLPFKDGSVDCCVSIAVIHHLSTEDRRLKAISEMVRVLVPGGEALIYVWAKNQERDQQKSSYLKQCNNKPSEEKPTPISPFSLPVHTNRTQFCHSDLLVPWKLKHTKVPKNSDTESRDSEEVYFRYYHMFEEGELEQLCSRLNNVSVERSYYDQGNWCVLLKKVL